MTKARSGSIDRRSRCPVACSLDILGDRWTLLVVRDLFLGRSRFRDFIASPEGIPTNILSDRLEKLLEHKLVAQVPADDGTRRMGYALTRKGQALGPVLEALRDWGLKWDKDTKVLLGVTSDEALQVVSTSGRVVKASTTRDPKRRV